MKKLFDHLEKSIVVLAIYFVAFSCSDEIDEPKPRLVKEEVIEYFELAGYEINRMSHGFSISGYSNSDIEMLIEIFNKYNLDVSGLKALIGNERSDFRTATKRTFYWFGDCRFYIMVCDQDCGLTGPYEAC